VSTVQFPARLSARRLPFDARRAGLVLSGVRDLLTVSGPILLELSIILSQSWQPGYNPLRDTISSMVWGPRGWVQTVNFFLIGATLAALASQLRPVLLTRAARWGGAALLVVGISFVVLGVCPSQSPGGPRNLPAIIHGITVYVIVFAFPLACFLMARAVRIGKFGRFLAAYSYVTCAFGVALIAAGAFLMAKDAPWFGMIERVLLLNGFTWMEVVAVYFAGGAALRVREEGRV
jgi:hypothetical protein